mmetsp:Transcript_10294/g.15725  ORF Transcript_10294/g.15725 Transcript_10294/m.15725 type:complete len:223 (+) Transcript_10294:304-972(+)|eukprot:CAMPEP_0170497930 /NCGR_PEP_ID=MMETSP0208-20121228/26278_1 /TAXON_ID=197538 /ORGANISM="Strombidium inclinatum, Strain S3" /LENGTH=222 /DNA_ID=CAMNT_0010774913 /DNA_START=221 /DNA_END=889 /DNA_ORIENTATION=+
MLKAKTLRPEAKESRHDPMFSRGGQPKIPIGVRGSAPGIRDKELYGFEPKKIDKHPDSYYKNNRLSSKAEMHDFRPTKKAKSTYDGMLAHKMTATSTRQRRLDNISGLTKKISGFGLEPILETEDAQAVHLRHLKVPRSTQARKDTSRRSVVTYLSDPDNGILFLDNYDRVYNPTNQKTPPPPMWGEVLEEDLYDDSIPFYDEQLAEMEMEERHKKLEELKA